MAQAQRCGRSHQMQWKLVWKLLNIYGDIKHLKIDSMLSTEVAGSEYTRARSGEPWIALQLFVKADPRHIHKSESAAVRRVSRPSDTSISVTSFPWWPADLDHLHSTEPDSYLLLRLTNSHGVHAILQLPLPLLRNSTGELLIGGSPRGWRRIMTPLCRAWPDELKYVAVQGGRMHPAHLLPLPENMFQSSSLLPSR